MRPAQNQSRIPEEEFQKCIQVLRSGGTILYPTDTVWGIGCDAKNEKAVEKVYAIKQRSDSKSLIVLLHDESMLNKYVHEVPGVAWDLIELSEKPLTIIFDQVGGMAPNVVAADGSCGIRICKEEFCNRLLHKFGRPLVSTSANISGKPTPHNFREISEEIRNAVDYVVDWRREENAQFEPSTIMRLKNDGQIEIIRK
ncbi:MAG TPA: L-threonylcarbamoyladenylate synthase [Bacteroidia bacterium]|jgi:L-threonylcarbamoyladenylate synthase|nr:L-threonylcarbamoyladenylate synthase [Bacteroidia bacterium]